MRLPRQYFVFSFSSIFILLTSLISFPPKNTIYCGKPAWPLEVTYLREKKLGKYEDIFKAWRAGVFEQKS